MVDDRKKLKQTTINFFASSAASNADRQKPSSRVSNPPSTCRFNEELTNPELDAYMVIDSPATVTYQRRKIRQDCCADGAKSEKLHGSKGHSNGSMAHVQHSISPQDASQKMNQPSHNKVIGQYFLDLGQSNFSYSICKTCGILYASGHGDDEKLHTAFHKTYLQGVQFKGWQKERVIAKYDGTDDRILLVLSTDPPQYQVKVNEVIKLMENELGLIFGWLLVDQCKVYLFVSSKKVVGCVVVEHINEAFPVVSVSAQGDVGDQAPHLQVCLAKQVACCGQSNVYFQAGKNENENMNVVQDECVKDTTRKRFLQTLAFGNLKFQREVRKLKCSSLIADFHTSRGAIVCSAASVPALCGIRALWVSRGDRRKGIATKLLDAVRASFIYGFVLDPSQCAFSQPTLDGRAFAVKYCQNVNFLVYS